jgi:hypothetical protein
LFNAEKTDSPENFDTPVKKQITDTRPPLSLPDKNRVLLFEQVLNQYRRDER